MPQLITLTKKESNPNSNLKNVRNIKKKIHCAYFLITEYPSFNKFSEDLILQTELCENWAWTYFYSVSLWNYIK